MDRIKQLIQDIGKSTISKFNTFRAMIALFYDILIVVFEKKRERLPIRQVINQILFIGVDSLLITSAIAFIVGIMLTHFSFDNMTDFGASSKYGILIVLTIVIELSPFITAMVVIGRSGAAFTTFIGNMAVTREIDALESMGISILDFLILPSILGMVVSLIALSFYFDIISIISGLLFAKSYYGASFFIYLNQITNAIVWSDIPLSLIKSILFGIIISIVSSYHGLTVTSTRIVPRAVYRSVITSTTTILIFNILISALYYGIRSKIA